MSPSDPILLVASPLLGPLSGGLSGPFEIERLWEIADPAAFAAERGGRVRAILTIGELKLDPGFLNALPNLGLIACFTAGYDQIDIAWCRDHGVAVTHSPAVNAEDVADHAVGRRGRRLARDRRGRPAGSGRRAGRRRSAARCGAR